MIRDGERGQTTLDFAIGTSVFLVAVLFVLVYAPTLFDPFAGGTGSKLLVADRAATSLSGDFLAVSTAEPGTLSAACVGAFFDVTVEETVQHPACGGTDLSEFDEPGDLDELLSLDGRSTAVTVHDLDASAATPAQPSWAGGPLYRSNDASTPNDVAVATRAVSIGGEQYRLTVQVW